MPSAVWNHFHINSTDESKATCKICNIDVSRGTGGPKTYGTYLKFKHTREYASFTNPSQQTEKEATSSGIVGSLGASTQLSVGEFLQHKKLWDISNPKSVAISNKIGEMIAIDNQPYTIVEDDGFRNLIQHVEPRYQIPSRKYFSETVIPSIEKKVRQKICNLVISAEWLFVTTDIWSSTSNESFISLTAHCLDEMFNPQVITLNAKHFPGFHTGIGMETMLTDMATEWKTEKAKIHLILHDNTGNMNLGINLWNVQHESCFIHTLQLAIKDTNFSQRSVSDTISSVRSIVGHFKHFPLACDKLKSLQVDCNFPQQKLLQDVQTIWNSTYYMLQRQHTQRRAIALYTVDSAKVTNLTSYQWELVEQLLRVLLPFEEIMQEASKRDACISISIPCIQLLLRYLGKRNHDKGIQTLKEGLYK